MFIAVTCNQMEAFATDLDTLKAKEEEHLNSAQIVEELTEKLAELGESGEESYIYKTQKCDFHFIMEENDGLSLSIRYTGYTEL